MATAYDRAFFSFVADDSLRSARVIVPIVSRLLSPKSVVDFGCGPGAWLRVFIENGVTMIKGIDGDYVQRDELLIDPDDFIAADLTESISLDQKYDLAICIEVGEHLPKTSGHDLIKQLTSAAPAVLFSAAIPGQEGINHVNEQWLRYWRDLFAAQGFTMVDALRPGIRDDLRVSTYIRQNLVLFLGDLALASRPQLRRIANEQCDSDNEWIHINLYEKWLTRATTAIGAKDLLRKLPAAVRRSIARRVRKSQTPK